MTGPIPAKLNIVEVDGVPSTYPYKLIVSNSSLTDNGDGTATLSVGSSTGGTVTISELISDPVAPAAESAWVLQTGCNSGKLKAFLGLSFPYVGKGCSYQFSYRTKAGTTKRVLLS